MGYDQKVEAVKDRLRSLGAKVKVRDRQLTHRRKTYLIVRASNEDGGSDTIIMTAVKKHFPEAYVTSGSFSNPMNLTIALKR